MPQHGGREIKSIGDGFLVEFSSALQAVRCAIAIQTSLVEQNASAAEERRIQVRIGLHLGDVEVRDGDVFGDGVNIAARIEPLADAGGICITGPVADQVHNKIKEPLERLRQAPLKNIKAAVDVYRVILPWTQGAPKRIGSRPAPRGLALRAATIAALVGVVAALGWWLTTRAPHTASTASSEPPSKKSVAVLPFVNMSSDKENEYFSARRYEEAIKQLRTAVAVDPDYWWAHMWLGRAYAHAGRFSEAIAEMRAAQKLFQSPEIESTLGRVYADAGDRTKATEVLEHLRRQMKDAFVSASFLAALHIGLGHMDEAFASLAQAETEHSYYVGFWKVDPDLDPLRSDPRFAALLKKVGLDK